MRPSHGADCLSSVVEFLAASADAARIGLFWSLGDGLAGPPVLCSNGASRKSDRSNGYTVKLV